MEPLAYGNSSWEEIRQALAACRVKQVFQSHSLEVSAALKDGSVLTAREPAIDDIIDEAAAAEPGCGKIIMATE
jgi:hypothetical protein